ncbi:MAG: glycosyltransferase family 4 protein [Candidatus Wallbacteria bacterium]|mgnify:CR=1 FL=1
MKKILYISSLYPTDKMPSYGIFVKRCEEGLIQNGFDLIKIVLNYKFRGIIGKILEYLKFYIKIIKAGFLENYDIIYGHYPSHICFPLILVSLSRKTKIVLNVHGGDLIPENKYIGLSYNLFFIKILSFFLSRADLIVSPSKHFYDILTQKYKVKKEKIFISPSGGVNRFFFHPLPSVNFEKQKLKLSDKFVIGYISRIDKKKGWHIYLEALKRLRNNGMIKNIHGLIVGAGPDLSELTDKINEYKLENDITYITQVNPESLVDYYNILDIFIFPTFKDSLGLVGIEAMACGIPVIGSIEGGLKDYIVEGENGFFFQTGNDLELTQKIEYYYQLDQQSKQQLKDNALKTSELFEFQNISRTLANKINNLPE